MGSRAAVGYHRRVTTGRVFRRSTAPNPPVAVEAHGATIRDTAGREYLDAAGGAIVVNVGHGRASIAEVMAEQAVRLAYAHGSVFTTEPLEAYAAEIGRHLPVDGPAIYPVSGGSEAIETALKLARAYHLANGEPAREIVISRWGSYHGNTLGALDLSGRPALRRPYEPWLGRFRHVSAAYPYGAGRPGGARPRGRRRARRRSWTTPSRRPGRGPSRPSWPNRSSARRWPPPCRPTTTGRGSRRSARATACCSSPTRS